MLVLVQGGKVLEHGVVVTWNPEWSWQVCYCLNNRKCWQLPFQKQLTLQGGHPFIGFQREEREWHTHMRMHAGLGSRAENANLMAFHYCLDECVWHFGTSQTQR